MFIRVSSSQGCCQGGNVYKVPEVAQSHLTLCNPMDCSPPGSSVRGVSQARILEWVAIPFSRGSSNPGIEPRSPAWQADSLPSEPPGKPNEVPGT